MQDHKIIKFGTDYQFNTEESLGEGGQGIVFLGKRINRLQFDTQQLPDTIAIKVITFSCQSQKDQIRKQIQANKYLKSPGVVSIYKYGLIEYQGHNAIAIAMQLMEGTLQQMLKKEYEKKPIPVNKAIEIYHKIVTAYECFFIRSEQKKKHNPGSQDIIHRDIKPANILYKHEGNNLIFKIGDLGALRNHQQSKTITTQAKRTKIYASPQQLSYKKVKYTNKADLYATGVILFQLLNGYGKHPIQVQDPVSGLCCVDYDQNKKLNQDATTNVLKELGVQSDLIEFIIKCLKRQEQQRFSWKDVFGHKIFKKYLPMKEQATEKNEKNQNSQNNQNKLKITPDANTYAWKQNKYRQDNANKNVCIYQGQQNKSDWLCSAKDLDCDGECVFIVNDKTFELKNEIE